MTYVKNIQGLGSKGADSYYDGTVPNAASFSGVDWYIIGDIGTPYNPLPIPTPRTYLTLYKINTEAFASFIYATHESGGSYKGESVQTFLNGTTRVFMRDSPDSNQTYNQSSSVSINGKWHTFTSYYNGSGDLTSTPQFKNGQRQITPSGASSVSGSINTAGLGYIAKDNNVITNTFVGEIAIFSIYKGLFTAAQEAEFASNPFGFMTSLRAIPAEKAKLYLDIDFNKTGANLPTDEGTGNGGVGFPISLGGGTASYTPFA